MMAPRAAKYRDTLSCPWGAATTAVSPSPMEPPSRGATGRPGSGPRGRSALVDAVRLVARRRVRVVGHVGQVRLVRYGHRLLGREHLADRGARVLVGLARRDLERHRLVVDGDDSAVEPTDGDDLTADVDRGLHLLHLLAALRLGADHHEVHQGEEADEQEQRQQAVAPRLGGSSDVHGSGLSSGTVATGGSLTGGTDHPTNGQRVVVVPQPTVSIEPSPSRAGSPGWV